MLTVNKTQALTSVIHTVTLKRGVTAALGILVPSVQVRILALQQKNNHNY